MKRYVVGILRPGEKDVAAKGKDVPTDYYSPLDVQEKQVPLICYAVSRVETSIGPRPIGDEPSPKFHLWCTYRQARHVPYRELTTQSETLYQDALK